LNIQNGNDITDKSSVEKIQVNNNIPFTNKVNYNRMNSENNNEEIKELNNEKGEEFKMGFKNLFKKVNENNVIKINMDYKLLKKSSKDDNSSIKNEIKLNKKLKIIDKNKIVEENQENINKITKTKEVFKSKNEIGGSIDEKDVKDYKDTHRMLLLMDVFLKH
jgi:hypothetical protein